MMMMVSPASSSAASASMVLPVMSSAGTITQVARGTVSFWARSASDVAPVAPSCSSAATAPGFTS